MIKSCALMTVYNEEDIILESVTKLIDQGVDVFIVDNASTDATIEKVQHLVGRGVIDIQHVKYLEDNKEVYKWESLLKDKEEYSKKLGYDWYLHVDADEIRYSPWEGVSLSEGINRVDDDGYNLINFKLFNFRLYKGIVVDPTSYESSMEYYSSTERFNQIQVKAWKYSPNIDITSFGGHIANVPNSKVYPIRFIHKHYPVRSEAHAIKKILNDRKARFSPIEKNKGWHLQYDHIVDELMESDYLYPLTDLMCYEHKYEIVDILNESSSILVQGGAFGAINPDFLDDAEFVSFWQKKMIHATQDFEYANNIFNISMNIAQMLPKVDVLPIQVSLSDKLWIDGIVRSYARKLFLTGRPALYSSLNKLMLME